MGRANQPGPCKRANLRIIAKLSLIQPVPGDIHMHRSKLGDSTEGKEVKYLSEGPRSSMTDATK